jgi:7-carboxy-7-deazaguanine synthase
MMKRFPMPSVVLNANLLHEALSAQRTTTYPISQSFHSVQGEGALVGTPMLFTRTAGCCVGVYSDPARMEDASLRTLRVLHPRHSVCTSALGQSFLCDTDYHSIGTKSIPEILKDMYETHLCITGGEPFMYSLLPLVVAVREEGFDVQIETSGAVPIPPEVGHLAWITCSPKAGYLPENARWINEFKFVLSAAEARSCVETFHNIERILSSGDPVVPAEVFLQPINAVETVDKENLTAVLAMLAKYPRYRLSVQLHKLLGLE